MWLYDLMKRMWVVLLCLSSLWYMLRKHKTKWSNWDLWKQKCESGTWAFFLLMSYYCDAFHCFWFHKEFYLKMGNRGGKMCSVQFDVNLVQFSVCLFHLKLQINILYILKYISHLLFHLIPLCHARKNYAYEARKWC